MSSTFKPKLAAQVVHGDLSADSVLNWAGEIAIIDFPQLVDPRHNTEVADIFRHDVKRVCECFAPYGVANHPGRVARELSTRHADASVPQSDGCQETHHA